MRLLYVSDTDRVHDRRFVDAYRTGGFEVRALALGDAADPVDVVRAQLAQRRPDAVHAGPMTTAAWFAAQALSELETPPPMIAMSWGSDVVRDAESDPKLAERVQGVTDAAALIQCDSIAVQRALEQKYGVDAAQVIRFPWGIDPRRFGPGAAGSGLRERLGLSADSRVVLSTRNFEPVYDIPTLLAAFKAAHYQNGALQLVMLGQGSGEEAARSWVAESGLDDAVTFIGHIDNRELPEFFRLASVYLACSLSDGASVSLLEAMASGLPVVVSDIEANREWVTPGSNGWLARTGQPGEYAADILSAIGLADEDREEMAARNRSVATTRADWSANVPRLLEAVRSLASAG